MRKATTVLLVVIAVLIASLLAQSQSQANVVWEYKLVPSLTVLNRQHVDKNNEMTAARLGVYGADGWELVAILQEPGNTAFVMKRQQRR